METRDYTFPAGQPAAGRALAGIVGSGDLEVLLQPGSDGVTRIVVNTSVDGKGTVWMRCCSAYSAASRCRRRASSSTIAAPRRAWCACASNKRMKNCKRGGRHEHIAAITRA